MTLTMTDDAEAFEKAARHLSASPYFRTIEIRRGADIVGVVRRRDLIP